MGLGGDPGWGKEILGLGGAGNCYIDLHPEGARPPFLLPSNKLKRQTEESSENFLMSFGRRGEGGREGSGRSLRTFEKPRAILPFPSQGAPPPGSVALGNSAGPLGLSASWER